MLYLLFIYLQSQKERETVNEKTIIYYYGSDLIDIYAFLILSGYR